MTLASRGFHGGFALFAMWMAGCASSPTPAPEPSAPQASPMPSSPDAAPARSPSPSLAPGEPAPPTDEADATDAPPSDETPPAPLELAGRRVRIAPPIPGRGTAVMNVVVDVPGASPVAFAVDTGITDCERGKVDLVPVVDAPRLALAQAFCENGEDEFSRAIVAVVLDVGDATHTPKLLWEGKGHYANSFDRCERIDVPTVRGTGPGKAEVVQLTEVISRPNPRKHPRGGSWSSLPIEVVASSSIMGGRGDESELAWRLGERVKELTLLHGVARLLQTGRSPDEALLAEVVALVPPAWQFPEICEARIRWLQVEARTPGWSESPWILRAALGPTPDEGILEIAYRQAPSTTPEAPEEPFLREERELIASLAEMLGASFARSRAEVLLREREARLSFLFALSERTRAATEVDEMLAIVVEMLGRELRASRCAVVHVEDDGRRCWVPHDYTDGCPSLVGPYEMTAVGAELVRDAGRPIVARDIAAELPPDVAAKQLGLGVRAMIVASHVRDGAVRSMMAVQQTTPRDWTEHEVQLVTETVSRTWAHIEQRSTEAKLRRVEGHLRQAQKMEAIGQLAAGVAHDFSNLLSVILSYSTFIIEELPPGDAVRADVSEIENAAKRGVELTRQLLTFSRKQPLQPKPCSLTTIAGGVEKMLRRLIGDRIRLGMHCQGDAGQTLVNPGQVEQVLMNLVVNARDAMPEGGEITIRVENVTLAAMRVDGQEVTPGGYVMLAVRDTGQGMDAATRARIFEPFFTTKEKGKGTGLGLATVYGIVKQSGGHIQVVTEPGAGTTFSVYFPRIDEVAAAVTTPVLAPSTEPPIELRPKPATYAGDGEHVLLVDDEEALVMLTERVLKRLGYRVTGFTSGADALAALRASPDGFQAVVTDVSMPGMSGFQLTRQVWQIRPDMPVVVTSGYFTDEDMRTASAVGLRSLVVKPDTIEELGRVLHEALRHDLHRRAG